MADVFILYEPNFPIADDSTSDSEIYPVGYLNAADSPNIARIAYSDAGFSPGVALIYGAPADALPLQACFFPIILRLLAERQ
jgi:hypothetical protein